MLAVKKAVQGIVDREQNRILVVSLTQDEKLMVIGDNLSVANVDANEQRAEVLKAALKDTPVDTDLIQLWKKSDQGRQQELFPNTSISWTMGNVSYGLFCCLEVSFQSPVGSK
jgi:hypothetical protein